MNEEIQKALDHLAEKFIANEKILLQDPLLTGIEVSSVYRLQNGVDIKITIGRNLENEHENQ